MKQPNLIGDYHDESLRSMGESKQKPINLAEANSYSRECSPQAFVYSARETIKEWRNEMRLLRNQYYWDPETLGSTPHWKCQRAKQEYKNLKLKVKTKLELIERAEARMEPK